MKKPLLIFFSGITILSLLLNNASGQASKANSKSSLSVLNGAWNSVNQTSGGMEHCLYHDGFVTNIDQDSTGTWRDIYSGTYEISGNIYKQKILYCSNPQYMGGTHWQEFKVKGDTLYLTFYKKVLDPSGNDVTSQFGAPVLNKYVRVKK